MTFNFLLLAFPYSIHSIQHSRFARQDGWELDDISLCLSGNIAVSGHHYDRRTFVCIYSTVDNSDSRDKPTLLYEKEFKKYSDYWLLDLEPWPRRYVSFMKLNSTEILVTCQHDIVTIIDYQRDLVLRSRKVNRRTTCLSVSESQIFIGLEYSSIVNIYDNDLNEIKSIRLKGIRGEDWPRDIAAAADRLYVCTFRDGRAIVYSQSSDSCILAEYGNVTGQEDLEPYSITVSVQHGVAAVLWRLRWSNSKRQVTVYSLTNNNCLVVFDVESSVSRIRISDQGRIVTGNERTVEVKIYELRRFFSDDTLSFRLAQLMSSDEIKELGKHFSISDKELDQNSDSNELTLKKKNVKKLVTILKEKGIFCHSKANELKGLFDKLLCLPTSKLIAPILLHQKYGNTFADVSHQPQPTVNKGRSEDSFSVSPSHSISIRRFPAQDNWQNVNILNIVSTIHGQVCYVKLGKKREENVLTQLFKLPSSDTNDSPQLIYSKVVSRQGYKELFLTFIDETQLVKCYNKTLEVIDINSNEVVVSQQLHKAAKCMTVEEGEIFLVIGDTSEVLVFNQNLEEVTKLTFRFQAWKYPSDLQVTTDRLFVICKVRPREHHGASNWPVRAISFRREDREMTARYIISSGEYEPVSIAAHKESEFVGVLWSINDQWPFSRRRQMGESMVSLHTLPGCCIFLLDVNYSHKIRILDKNTMVTINKSDGLKYYNMAHFFTVDALAIRLSCFIEWTECVSLQELYGISEEEMNRTVFGSMSNRYNMAKVSERLVQLFKILEEKKVLGPNNLDGLVTAVGKVRSALFWSFVEGYLWFSAETSFSQAEFLQPGSSLQDRVHVTQEIGGEDGVNVSHKEKEKVQLDLPHQGASYLQPGGFTLQQQKQQHLQQLQQQAQQQASNDQQHAALQQQHLVLQQHAASLRQQSQQQATVQQQALLHQQQLYQQQQHQNQVLHQQRQLAQQRQSQGSKLKLPPGFGHMHVPNAQTPLLTHHQGFNSTTEFSHQQAAAVFNQQQSALYSQQQAAYNTQLHSQLPSGRTYMPQHQQVAYPYHQQQQVQQQQAQQYPVYQQQTFLKQQGAAPNKDQFGHQPFAEIRGVGQGTTSPTSVHHHHQQVNYQCTGSPVQVAEGIPVSVDNSLKKQVTSGSSVSSSGGNPFTNLETKNRLVDDQLADSESERLIESPRDKKSLFVECLKKRIQSWSRNMTFIPWERSGRWKSTDLFVYCGLILSDSKSRESVKNIDEQYKVNYTEIFSDEKLKSETRIFIEGGPGTGKTMLSAQLAYDWSKGNISDVDILIFVPLKFVEDKLLVQAIKELYIPANIPISEKDIEDILASESETLCLLLDGLEEFSVERRMGANKSSEVMKIVNKVNHPTCKVVITTRSGFTEDLQDYPLLKIGLFDKPERNSYIGKLLPEDIKKQESVKLIIEDDSFLLELCGIPLLFAPVIHNVESMSCTEESQFDRVAPFMKNLIDTLCSSCTLEHKTWSETEKLILGELAFSGLCKGQQQLSWQREFIETKVTNLKHWIDSRVLVVEEDIVSGGYGKNKRQESDQKRGNDSDEEKDESDRETSHSLAETTGQQYKNKRNEEDKSSNRASMVVRFLHKVIQQWFAATYMCSMMQRCTDEDQLHEYVISQLRHISPKDLHYVLRFTCYLYPPSSHAIMNYLLTSFLEDGDIASYAMDCICLCFAEHNDIKGSDIKNTITEVCKEVITIDSQDGRFLQQAKSALLQFASNCEVIIKELLLRNVVVSVDETFFTLNSGTKLGLLNTLQVIEVSQWWDQGLQQDDYLNTLKLLSKGNCITSILCFFPSQPPEILDDLTIDNILFKDIEVEWNNGYFIWTLDPKKRIFLPVFGTMTKASDVELKTKEDAFLSHEQFLMSLPGGSTPSFDKWSKKRPFSKMLYSDLKGEAAAKQLKMNWNLKRSGDKCKKEEIFDLSKDYVVEKACVSDVEQKVVKQESPTRGAAEVLVKEEITESEVEQSVVQLEDPRRATEQNQVVDSFESKEETQQPTTSSFSVTTHSSKHTHTDETQKRTGSDSITENVVPEKKAKVVPEEVTVSGIMQRVPQAETVLSVSEESGVCEEASVSGVEERAVQDEVPASGFDQRVEENPVTGVSQLLDQEGTITGADERRFILEQVPTSSVTQRGIQEVPAVSSGGQRFSPGGNGFNGLPQEFIYEDSFAGGTAHRVVPEYPPMYGVVQNQLTAPPNQFLLQAEAVITQFGGEIEIPNTGVFLSVPPNALPEDVIDCRIQMRIIPISMCSDNALSFSSNSSVRVELLPNHFHFRCHVELTLPHCLELKKNVLRRARIFMSHHNEGDVPQWEEQVEQFYELLDTTCIISLKSFCWIKFEIDDEIVEAKRLKIYTAARKMYLEDKFAVVEVGYHLDMPGEQQILKMNPELILVDRKPFVFLREGKHSLFVHLMRIVPQHWKYFDQTPKEITFFNVAASVEQTCQFMVAKQTQNRDTPMCFFVASQRHRTVERTVELMIRPEVHPFATPWDARY